MITGIFGKPRSGKTTYSAKVVQDNKFKLKLCSKLPLLKFVLHPYDIIYCTDPTISDTVYIDYSIVGKFKPSPNSLIILEECGIGFNNRSWKNTSLDAQHLFAYHGHIGVDILWSSQTVDVDKKLLDRTHLLYFCEKCVCRPNRSRLRRIRFSPDIDESTHQLINMYFKSKGLLFLFELLFRKSFTFDRRRYYKYFDSYMDDWSYTLPDPALSLSK